MPLRDASDRISPTFMLGPTAKRIRYAINSVCDAIVEMAGIGVKARFPEKAPEDALAIIGRDRRIMRGFAESSVSYRARLLRWLDDWRIAGSPFAIMGQIAGYILPNAFRMRVVYTSAPSGGTALWYTREADASKAYVTTTPTNWDWDGVTSGWYRFWVVLYSHAGPWTATGIWGGSERWGDTTGTWGLSASNDEVQSIRQIVNDWKPAHATGIAVIVAFDSTKLSPTAAPGAPMPDGTWGKQYKNSAGTVVASRDSALRYIEVTNV